MKANNHGESQTYSIAEVSRLLMVSKHLVYELIKQNQLPGVLRLGRVLRVSKAAFHRMLEEGHQVQRDESL